MPQALPISNFTRPDILSQESPYLPTGYTSQPMSRDASRESTHSLATAPPATGTGAASFSPPQSYAYLLRTDPTLASSYPSIESGQLRRIGSWAELPPVVPLAPVISLDGTGNGVVQFGAASPVNLVDARTRADEYARRLVPFERGDYRPNRGAKATQLQVQPGSVQEEDGTEREGTLHGVGMTVR